MDEIYRQAAEDLRDYLQTLEKYIIIEGLSKDDYDKAVKKVKKAIKKLENGKGDEVIDKEMYRKLVDGGLL